MDMRSKAMQVVAKKELSILGILGYRWLKWVRMVLYALDCTTTKPQLQKWGIHTSQASAWSNSINKTSAHTHKHSVIMYISNHVQYVHCNTL